jgi:hypothetical protein
MKKQNLISLIFTVIFITVFSIFNFSEYKEFHTNKAKFVQEKNSIKLKINNFKLEDIKPINDISFYPTPDKNLLNKIVEHIKNAKEMILLETYMLTEKRIQEALINANKK